MPNKPEPGGTYYDYELIPESERRGKYCQAPRHGLTNVQAMYLERFASEEFKIPPTQTCSCEDCHDSMMLAYMEESLPEATPEELRDAGLPEDYYD